MATYFSFKQSNGFTLLELMVIITLVAMLALSGFSSYSASQKSARDSRRKTDLETVRQALELYRSANSALYVNYTGNTQGSNALKTALTNNGCYGSACMNSTSYPSDPRSDQNYYYRSVSPNTTYCIYSLLEQPTTQDTATCPASGCVTVSCGTANCNYCLTQHN